MANQKLQVLRRGLIAVLTLVAVGAGLRAGFILMEHRLGIVLPPIGIIAVSVFVIVAMANILFAFVLKRVPMPLRVPVIVKEKERGELIIKRIRTYTDLHRNYEILLDNIEIGEIGPESMARYEVPAGLHTLTAKIDWCRSRPLQISVRQNETLVFEVINAAQNSKILPAWWYAVFAPSAYLSLMRIQ